jgi:hypothetical protein
LEKGFGTFDRNPAHLALDQSALNRTGISQVVCFLMANCVPFAELASGHPFAWKALFEAGGF